MSNAEVRANVLGLPENGNKRIVLVERDRDRAKDWVRQSRELSGGIMKFNLHKRALRAEGICTFVYVVVGWRVVRGDK